MREREKGFALRLVKQKFMDLPDSSNRFLVSLKGGRLVHVRLPVLHEAVVVAGDHPRIVVRPDHRSDRHGVRLKRIKNVQGKLFNQIWTTYLQNGFEVEGQTIPQRELAGAGSCDQPTALRRPCKREDWAAHLVCGGLHKSRRDGVAGVVQIARGWHKIGNVTVLRLQRSPVAVVALPDSILKAKEKLSKNSI